MALIPVINLTEFKRLKKEQIQEMQSVIVMADGEPLFIAIIPPLGGGMTITDTIRTEAEYLGARGNTVGGKTPDAFV
jgi:hypothetical protein